MNRTPIVLVAVALVSLLCACGEAVDEETVPFDVLVGTLGPSGGALEGDAGTSLEGVVLAVPAGALTQDVAVEIQRVEDDTPLPENAFGVGPQFDVTADGVLPGAQLTVPFDPEQLRRFIDDVRSVKVWRRAGESWVTAQVVGQEETRVTVTLDELTTYGAGVSVED